MKSQFDKLEYKPFISELLPDSKSFESEIYSNLIKELSLYMNNEISSLKKQQDVYENFISNWVHEVKTPIATLKLMIENNQLSRNDVRFSVNEIESYVEQVLYYLKAKSLNEDFMISKLNINEIVKETIKKDSRLLIQSGIKLKMNIDGIYIYSDKKWLVYIISQVIQNAAKYRRSNPIIFVKAKEYDDKIVLSIFDNGIGIDDSDIKNVFKKGYTGVIGRKYIHSTGMGLYLANELSLKLGISLKIESKLNHYTRVSFIFPKVEKQIDSSNLTLL